MSGELPAGERGIRIALVFALTAERLAAWYEHGAWLNEARGAALAADWLGRRRQSLALAERRRLSALSEDMARQMVDTLSREAGLYTAHEMMEALDPNYHSELAQTLMRECERLLDAG